MRHVQDEHDSAAGGLLEDLVFVGVVEFDAPVLFPGDQLVVDAELDIAFGHFDSQVVAHAGVRRRGVWRHVRLWVHDREERQAADAADASAAAQELRDPWTLARVVDLEVASPIVEGENGPVAAVRQSHTVVPRVDLVLARVDTGEFLSKKGNGPLAGVTDLLRGPDWVAG